MSASVSIVSSWPHSVSAGSGTAVFAQSLRAGIEALGVRVNAIGLPNVLDDYAAMLDARAHFNQTLADDDRLQVSDWVLGLDYDGYLLNPDARPPLIASARALFADIAPTEPEPFRSYLYRQAELERINFTQADHVTVPSDYARQKLIELHELDEANISVIYNAIDCAAWDKFLEHERDTGVELRQSERPTLLVVAKFFPRKRIDVLLRALPLVKQHFADVQLRVAGDGQQASELHALADELGIDQQVEWLGNISRQDVALEMCRCHIFVNPSQQETFGNVCLEAMAAGRPLVVASAASLPEIVTAAGGGLIVEENSPESFATSICRLLNDVDYGNRLGEAGRAFAERQSWTAVAGQYLSLARDIGASDSGM